jgi:flagellar basal-body rod modification protein FlgD
VKEQNVTAPIDPTLLSSVNGTQGSSAAKASTAETRDRFLSMLVAQMRNQDPLNPLDNAQVTSQMAQLSTVEGIEKMNKTLAALAENFGADQLAQAAGLIGHKVLVGGNTISLADGVGSFGLNLQAPAETVTISIRDAAGQLVSTVDAGALAAGQHLFEWDGMDDAGVAMPAGSYRVEATAGRGKDALALETLSSGSVQGVSRGERGIELNVEGLGKTAYADVRHIH